ncbi:MAG TPA: hypothetical protein VFV94_19585 [Polyangiaceae bacterium]|nr:hypothetical protein [Polyangiaceae bacterium]
MEPLTLRALGFAVGGWLSAGACVVASAWHVRRLARRAPPVVDEVRARLRQAGSPAERDLYRMELREDQREAERALSLATLLPRSLARVALATGTALSLTTLARGLPLAGPELVAGAAGGFVGGFVGMLGCAAFGRQARSVAVELRQRWKRVHELVEREWTREKASG